MFYYLYEIKNLSNDKIYVGVHKTKNMDDGYMGSGKVILRAIEKHGVENFTKTILETFDNSEAMFAREKEVVTDEFLARPDTYNLRRGGFGGFDHINKTRDPEQHRLHNIQAGLLGGRIAGKINGPRMANAKLGIFNGNYNGFKSAQHQQTAVQNAAITHRKSMWITDGKTNMKVTKNFPIPNGWKRGRLVDNTNRWPNSKLCISSPLSDCKPEVSK